MKRTLKVLLVLFVLLTVAGFSQGAMTGACGPGVGGLERTPC